jgi:SAM-dependent methyltransferase
VAEQLLADWAARVRGDREQVERCREVADPADFYAPVAERFRQDPGRTDDDVLEILRVLSRPEQTWLDIGAGGGRYALPLALRVRQVVAVEPSDSMIGVLRGGMTQHGIANIRVIQGRWPLPDTDLRVAGDVSLMAHVGYDIERIGPFLDAAEDATRRLCIAVMGESAMTTAATLFWEGVHGEPRVRLPALPELTALLTARGRSPEVRSTHRAPPTFESVDEALGMARRQLWVRPGSQKDVRLTRLAQDALVANDGRYTFDPVPTPIGVVSWEPR